MKQVSKLLVGYDGSDCADAAIDDLVRAGLPTALDALVITVADIILPPPDDMLKDDYMPAIRIPEVERRAQQRAQTAIKEAQAFADRGAARVRAAFPEWDVRTEVCCDSPAWAVLNAAIRENANLIVIGAHGHSVVGGRLILGSVSQRVLYEAQTSVRVARCWRGDRQGPIRIVVGFNGSHDSEVAVDSVASRLWPTGSEARIVTAHGMLNPEAQMVATEKLLATGFTVSEISRDGDPAHVLLSEAEEWGADSIFVGTRDVHGFQHLLHGSVSSAVAARARCSVEVSRAARTKTSEKDPTNAS